jgi:hypothetical protein
VVTVKAMVAVWTSEPEVPVTVTLVVPVVAVDDAVKVRVDVPVGVTGFVEKAAVTPVGNDDRLSVVADANPLTLVTVIVLGLFDPCATLTAVGAAVTVKPGVPALTAKTKSS